MFKQFLPAEDMISRRPVKCPICRKKAKTTTTIYTTKQQGVFANAGGESKGTEDTQDSDEEMSCCICMEDDLPELEKFPCGHLVCKGCCARMGFKDNLPESNSIRNSMSRNEWVYGGGIQSIQKLGTETIEIKSNVKSGEHIKNLQIKKVIIHEGVDTIGEKAFMDCFNIKEVVFPRSLKHIGPSAFHGCQNILKMNLEDTQVTRIRANTFENSLNFRFGPILLLPTCLKHIEEGAFKNTGGFSKVLFPKTLISIGEEGFYASSLRELLFESYDIDHTLEMGSSALNMTRLDLNKDGVALPKNTNIYIDRSSAGRGLLGTFEKGVEIEFVDEAGMAQLRVKRELRRQRELRERELLNERRKDSTNIHDFLDWQHYKEERKEELKQAARDQEIEMEARRRFELAARRLRTKK